jgi:hypothetical protein
MNTISDTPSIRYGIAVCIGDHSSACMLHVTYRIAITASSCATSAATMYCCDLMLMLEKHLLLILI